MTRRVLALAIVTLLVAGAAGAVAYDHARRDTIARGVTVNGVDVGGLNADQAARRLRQALLGPLRRPVRVAYHGRRFTLSARAAAVSVDVQGSVDRALARSRAGNRSEERRVGKECGCRGLRLVVDN